ncbi:hypothetical protein JCM10908_004326 [Rhodotorula pacifica]|uniref:uncharacterized protein n=1 Tax=Rhodotorula pacifica TaxID=1495444 RepID=UPI0031756BB3
MSYRTSLYPGALPSSTSASVLHAMKSSAKDKQREHQAFDTVHQQAHQLSQFLHAYADKYTVLTGGSEAVGDVVEHWQNVFRITALTLGSLAQKRSDLAPTLIGSSSSGDPSATQPPPDPADVVLPRGTLPDKLVRIPVRPAEEEEAALAAAAAAARGAGELDAVR